MKDGPLIRVWITKYALTSGVFEVDARVCLSTAPDGGMIEYRRHGDVMTNHAHRPDWHTSAEEANCRVRKMIESRISSLKKTLAKMEKIKAEYA